MNESLLLFAIGIQKFEISNWEDKKSKLLELIDFEDNEITECQTDYFKYNTRPPYFDSFVEILQEDLDNMATEYTEGLSDRYNGECPFGSLDRWQLWSQRYIDGQYHGAHNHGMMNISNVLYLEFDESKHIPTTFYSPFPNPYFGTISKATPPVKEGNIISFPSLLLHECPVQSTTTPRTIMSFNIPLQ